MFKVSEYQSEGCAEVKIDAIAAMAASLDRYHSTRSVGMVGGESRGGPIKEEAAAVYSSNGGGLY